MDSKHHGSESWEKSFFEITPDTVSVLSMKPAEDAADAMIVRVQERSGAASVMHLESQFLGLSKDVSLRPWEIKTLRIETSKQHKAHIVPVSALEI
jgi:hypothetical protein